jgi:hypothetical protein
MSKQKKNKQVINLNPENYIRQRARNLPVYKCWINDNWNVSGMATIFVCRKHVSENITLGFYLVDLKCLGIKDTFFQYNIAEELFLYKIEESNKHDLNYIEISYELAHNIIYAAIEYAEEYGFDPVPDFTRLTQYILEEDTDDIPLMDIHCGDENGQPLYVNTGFDTPAREKQIRAHLQQTAGYGNYHFISRAELDKYENYKDDDDDYYDDDNDYDDDDDDDNGDSDSLYTQIRDSLNELDEDELKKEFVKTAARLDENTNDPKQHESFIYTVILSDLIIDKIIDENKVSEYTSVFEKYFDVEIIEMFDLPNLFFSGLQCDDVEKLRTAYQKFNDKIGLDNAEKQLKKLRKITGDIPAIHYWELLYLDLSDDEYYERLDDYSQKYPDYFMFKMLQYSRDVKIDDRFKTMLQNVNGPVTDIELGAFFNRYVLCGFMYDKEFNIEELVAFEDVVKRYQKQNVFIVTTLVVTGITKIRLMKQYCGLMTDEKH